MDTGNFDIATAFKKLLAENKSLETRLEEYNKIINSRDIEIDTLQTMLSEGSEYRSSIDNQLFELKQLQGRMNDLQQLVSRSTYPVVGSQNQQIEQISTEEQFEKLKPAYAYLQSQLADLQTQLQDMNSRNLLLQQQTSRIAELESLLANAEQDIRNKT